MKKICLVLVALFVYAEAAYGLASAQVFYGYRIQKKSADMDMGEDIDVSAHLVTVAGHLSPLPLIPVGLGATYSPWVAYATAENEESSTGMEVGVELLGWLPMVPFVTPYAKINYTVWGYKKTTFKDDQNLPDKEEKVGGMEIGVGVSYDLLPLISVMAEVSQGLRTIEDEDFNATTLSIGFEVGI